MGLTDLVRIGLGIVLVVVILRRRRPEPARPTPVAGAVPGPLDALPDDGSRLARGVLDIRRTDPGFDPARFVGYIGMVFRATQNAWATRDISAARDRLTPELFRELQARCTELRSSGRGERVEEIDIRAEVTEAWQERGQDYVTAYIGGSMIDYTLDEASDGVVDGSRTIPRAVAEFWTFTRPAGLNAWMLSAIQAS